MRCAPAPGAVPGFAVAVADAASGTRPRTYGEPSSAAAVNVTRDGVSLAGSRSPGTCGAGSQTNVIRVLPFSPREVPIHVRITRERDGVLTAASAASTAFGGPGFGGASAR